MPYVFYSSMSKIDVAIFLKVLIKKKMYLRLSPKTQNIFKERPKLVKPVCKL